MLLPKSHLIRIDILNLNLKFLMDEIKFSYLYNLI